MRREAPGGGSSRSSRSYQREGSSADMSDSKLTSSSSRRARTRSSKTGKRKPWQPRWATLAWLIVSCAILSSLRLDRLGLPATFRTRTAPELVFDAIPRTIMTSLMESPTWEWGACSGIAPMYPASVCSRTYCLHSAAYPGTYIDLFYHAFQHVKDPSVLYMCEEPAGGQLGFRSESTQVSFIITYKDSPKRTVQCMLELFRTAREAESVEFVLVNDGSVNETSIVDAVGKTLHDHFGVRVTHVHNRKSLGYGAANNAGVHAASGKYIVLMNNDAFVTPGWLKALLDTMADEQKPGIVGPFFANSTGWVMEAGGVLWSDGSAANYGRYERPHTYHMYRRYVDYISAACIMLERAVFLQIGGFKKEYGLGYWEDTDLAQEVHAAGYKVVYQPMAVVVHNEGGSLSAAKEALMKKNHKFFISKWKHSLNEENCGPMTPLHQAAMRMTGAYRLMWIDDIVPEPDRDSGSIRALNMIRIFAALGIHVDYQATTHRAVKKYETEARFRGVNVLPIKEASDIDFKHNGRCMYNMILVARFYIYERVVNFIQRECPGIPVIFDTVDVHFLRDARVAMTGSARWNFANTDVQGVRDWLQSNATKDQVDIQGKMNKELALMRQSAVTVVVSTTEQQLLRQLVPGIQVHVVSNVHDVRVAGRQPEGCADRKGILFVGNFNHPPNQQAVLALLDDILPETYNVIDPSEKDEFVLHIVGSNRGVDTDLGRTRFNIQFHGWLSDVELMILYRSVKLVVAPLMSGAGVKGKINQAMLYGVPVIATPIAAEGMHLVGGVNCMLASTAPEFASHMLSAYRNCTLWDTIVKGGYQNIEDYFSMAAATRNMAQMLVQLEFAVPVPRHTYACSYH
ncbi:MAG: hypothetical protein J3K34DRAFT_439855 [Monoraphidium minutum]|nr:MAG: hypothetical protein J3K34DRAFT_439855 [Monoraphidium minutum]